MSILTNLLSLLGNNNLIPALIPSLTFVMASIIVFDPIFKTSSLLQQQSGVDIIVMFSLVIVLPVIILGYTLIALNPYLLKLFEGYVLFDRLPFMYRSEARKANRLLNRCKELKEQIQNLEHKAIKSKTPREMRLLSQLRQKYYATASAYDQKFPSDPTEIMPTSIGNILKSAETYAGTRYGMDGVVFWPRLIQVIPKEYKESIDASRNELSFLFNFSTLSIIFYIFCVTAVFYEGVDIATITAAGNPVMPFITSNIRFIIAGLFALFCNWFFNSASVYSVELYGVLIRSAYDLFRLDLLKQFRVKMPHDSAEEFYIWKNLNELILMGQNSLDFRPIEYDTGEAKRTNKGKAAV